MSRKWYGLWEEEEELDVTDDREPSIPEEEYESATDGADFEYDPFSWEVWD